MRMSLCLQSFNHPPHVVVGCVNEQKIKSRGKRIQGSVKLPSPTIIPQGGESSLLHGSVIDGNSSASLFGKAGGIGIIGGACLDATLNFVRKVATLDLQEEESNGTPYVLCSDPLLRKDLLSIKRSSFSGKTTYFLGKTEHQRVDKRSVVEKLVRKKIFLEKSGVCCIVMPCHIAHHMYEEVAGGCSIPFLHMGECVAKELKEAKFRPLEAGSSVRIGVLASNAALAARIYQDKLQTEGFEVILPDKATMEHAVIPAVEASSRKDTEGAQNLFRIAIQVLLVRAVNAIILASDDIREILPREDPLWKHCIDPVDALVRSAVNHAQSLERGK